MSRTHRSKKKKKKEEISSLAIFPFAGKQVRAAVYQRALFNFQATQRMRDGNLFASLGPFSQTLCPLCPLTPRTSSPGRYMKSLPLAWLSILAFFFFSFCIFYILCMIVIVCSLRGITFLELWADPKAAHVPPLPYPRHILQLLKLKSLLYIQFFGRNYEGYIYIHIYMYVYTHCVCTGTEHNWLYASYFTFHKYKRAHLICI